MESISEEKETEVNIICTICIICDFYHLFYKLSFSTWTESSGQSFYLHCAAGALGLTLIKCQVLYYSVMSVINSEINQLVLRFTCEG